MSQQFLSAPRSSSSRTISMCPQLAAKSKGVMSCDASSQRKAVDDKINLTFLSRQFTVQPALTNISTTAE